MSLLSIIQEAAPQLNMVRPQTFAAGSRDGDSMRAMLNLGGTLISVMRNTWGAGWDRLIRPHMFETVAGQAAYPLPADFSWIVTDTVWDEDQYWSLRGPLSPQEWAAVRSNLAQELTLRWRYRITYRDGMRSIELHPVPTGMERVMFEYSSKSWVSGGEVYKQGFEIASDESVFDQDLHVLDLIWRHRKLTGLEYAHDYGEFMQETRKRMALDTNAPVIRPGRWSSDEGPPWPTPPETGYSGYS